MSARFKSVQSYLLILLAASPLVAMSAEEKIQAPTFGEQMSVIVEAHERGEITYQEMMELRRELSGQFGREYKTPQLPNCEGARRFLPKCIHRISTQNSRKSTAPTTDPDSVDCGGLRKFTPRCLSRPNPFETPSDEPADAPLEQIEQISDIEEAEPTGTMAEEEKELRPQPATIEPKESEVEISVDEPELNCGGLRKFTLKCLRRPDPFEEAKKEATHLEVEIAPEKPVTPEEPKEEATPLEVEVEPEKPEAMPPLEIKVQEPTVTTQPQEPEPVSDAVEKVIIEEEVEEVAPQQVKCKGLRRFTLKCLRRPDAPEEPKKEATHLEVEIAPEKAETPEEPKEEAAQLEVEIVPVKPEAKPPLDIKVQEPTVTTQPQEPEPVSDAVEKVIIEEKEEVVETAPQQVNCTGLRRFTSKCKRKQDAPQEPKKEAAHLKVDIAPEKPEAIPPLEIKIQESKPEPDSITEVLNCTGLRKFSLKCLRRPNPFEEPPD